MFACFGSKKKVLQNEIFDLLDQNGDEIVSLSELVIVAKHLHKADIGRAQVYLETLQMTEPVEHIINQLGTNKVYRKQLKQLYARVSPDVWVQKIIPELKRAEIRRLQGYVN